MIDVKKATRTLGGLALLKFFPADDFARVELVSIVCEMASTNEQIEWLVKRARNAWNQWEGPRELRALFCSKFKPADGVECYSALPQFADGIPSEDESAAAPPRLPASARREIASREPVTASPSIAAVVSDLCAAKSLIRAVNGIPAPPVRELPIARPDYKPVTSADIEKAVQELRGKRALDSMSEEGQLGRIAAVPVEHGEKKERR